MKTRPDRIMIVDDDLDELPLYEMIGDIPDTLITIRNGGLSALRFLDNLNYDVDAVVLDLSMPDKDGLSVTREIRGQENIRSKGNPIEIFWLTGVAVEDDPTLMEAKDKYGVKEVFTKPVYPDEVVWKVKEHLNGNA
jgi:CheY-like chemotaxis protein